MPMTNDPLRIVAYDALFPQFAALEAGLDVAANQGQGDFGALQAQYQQTIDQTKTEHPDLVKAVEQAIPGLQEGLGGQPQKPGADASTEDWKNYRMKQNGAAKSGRSAGSSKEKPANSNAAAATKPKSSAKSAA